MVMQQHRPSDLLPPLENGYHLTREEYHRRYRERPDIKRAEPVGGVVYVASPVRFEEHSVPTGVMSVWAGEANSATDHDGHAHELIRTF